MKRSYLFLILIIITWACEDSSKVQPSVYPDIDGKTGVAGETEVASVMATSSVDLVRNTGNYHNTILSSVISNMGANPSINNTCYIADLTLKDVELTLEIDPITPQERLEQIRSLNNFLANDGELLQKSKLDAEIKYWINVISSDERTDNNERELLSEAANIFDLSEDTEPAVGYEIIYNRADRLITKYESIDWAPNQGEAVGGFLYIARSSAQFWRDQVATTTVAANGRIAGPCVLCWVRRLGAAQLDAAGYIGGWGKSWLVDEEVSAKKRIFSGLSTAVEWSGLGAIIKGEKGLDAVAPCYP